MTPLALLRQQPLRRRCAWTMLVLAAVFAVLPASRSDDLRLAAALAALLISLAFRIGGIYFGLRAIFPAVLAALLYGCGETILSFLAYPMRLVAATLAADPLASLGLNVHRTLTEITVGAKGTDFRLAVTYACSGIEQLSALLFVGYLFALRTQRTLARAFLQLVFLVPAIIFANALRLVAVLLGTLACGEAALSDGWHLALGYGQTILAILIFFVFGRLLKGIFR